MSNDSVTCSDTLFVYTSGVNILYRNQYRSYVFRDSFDTNFAALCLIQALTKILESSPPNPPFGFGDDQISIFAEIPDMVVPRE